MVKSLEIDPKVGKNIKIFQLSTFVVTLCAKVKQPGIGTNRRPTEVSQNAKDTIFKLLVFSRSQNTPQNTDETRKPLFPQLKTQKTLFMKHFLEMSHSAEKSFSSQNHLYLKLTMKAKGTYRPNENLLKTQPKKALKMSFTQSLGKLISSTNFERSKEVTDSRNIFPLQKTSKSKHCEKNSTQ